MNLRLKIITTACAFLLCTALFPQQVTITAPGEISLSFESPDKNEFTQRIANHPAGRHAAGIMLNTDINSNDVWWQDSKHLAFVQIKVNGGNAAGLSLYFDQLDIGDGNQLKITNESNELLFEVKNAEKLTSLPVFPYNTIVLQFSGNSLHLTRFKLTGVGCYFIAPPLFNSHPTINGFGSSGACQVNAACPEGDLFKDQQAASVFIQAVADGILFFATGTLVNNTANDKTPYILTAEHTALKVNYQLIDSAEFNKWLFRFNYRSASCANPQHDSDLKSQFVNGCDLVAHSNDSGGRNGSDFLLVKLKTQLPAHWPVYYAGWDRTGNAGQNGVCLHHPLGDILKVSTFTHTPITYSPTGSKLSHWLAAWTNTTNGHGTTEAGSSGAAMYNNNGLIMGTLTGGGSSCNSLNDSDFFGKFDYSWDKNGIDSIHQLAPWLDPGNTALQQHNGIWGGLAGTGYLYYKTINIYPNPTNARVTISNQSSEKINLILTDLAGKTLNTLTLTGQTSEQLNLAHLPPGIYLLGGTNGWARIVKE